MAYTTSKEHLGELIEALRHDPPRRQWAAVRQMKTIATQGWALNYELEDLIMAMDPRLNGYGAGDLKRLTAMFRLHWQSVAFRPKKIARDVCLHEALCSEDVARLLINLEALGFQVDPDPLVQNLLPLVQKRPMLTESALSVFWYARSRHRGPPLRIVPHEPSIPASRSLLWKTAGGYRIEVFSDQWGKRAYLEVHAPRFRRLPEPVETTCPQCGHTYRRGDPESSEYHRREHLSRMKYLNPQPHVQMLRARQSEAFPELVTTTSPAWKHREMYLRAWAFKREFRYDFVQWGSAKGDNDPKVHGFLFCDDADAIVGACAFRWRSDRWGLQWVWICPLHRRKGHLSGRWSDLRARFGDFVVETPVSDEMRAFLIRRNDSSLIEGEGT